MRAALLPILRAICVALLLPLSAGAQPSHHGGAQHPCVASVTAELEPITANAGSRMDASQPCDTRQDPGHAGWHCPVAGCAAIHTSAPESSAPQGSVDAVFPAPFPDALLPRRAEERHRPPDA
ncbi:hypothetical protein [Allosediminivita pacifica]|uniref:hypothetical protein n=1 Tax=Allosediminivita pacifica TaxID=1267769 RepID=UPI0011B23465|nr:hypothetical protein [Allosediminivita pacifica]GGB20091.1 hypothetical protein GCM10011324_32720 [Allosediminivita pacifica]